MPIPHTGSPARDIGYKTVQYLRRTVSFTDNGTAVTVGVVPAGALILRPLSGVAVSTVFNAGSTNVLDIGTSTTGDLYATDLALGTVAFVAIDEAVSNRVTVDTTITATVQLSGTAATTGSADVVIAFIV